MALSTNKSMNTVMSNYFKVIRYLYNLHPNNSICNKLLSWMIEIWMET